MAKRFIDTNIFADEFFQELSKDGKLMFIYFITNCDHAGILKLNKKLAEFQIGIKCSLTVMKELGNSIVTVSDGIFFMPKFIKFQYPNFPQSKVRQQDSALKILKSFNLIDENLNVKLNSYLTVSKELPNSYDNDSVSVSADDSENASVDENENDKKKFNRIIEILNQSAGTNFRVNSAKTIALIRFRFNEGFTLEDFEEVIRKKCRTWLKTDMAKYLRPETLFGTKFESYLNEIETLNTNNNGNKQTKTQHELKHEELRASVQRSAENIIRGLGD